jgi:hypothetical protein
MFTRGRKQAGVAGFAFQKKCNLFGIQALSFMDVALWQAQ